MHMYFKHLDIYLSACVHVCMSKDNFQDLLFDCHCVHLGDWSQAIRLLEKGPYLLSLTYLKT